MATDRQYVVARQIKALVSESVAYPSGEYEAKRSAIVGYAVELATLVLEDEPPQQGPVVRAPWDSYSYGE